jgi:L,D-peptidoglycan transpeptidase YkuD (ErfK/YbiS/YcfS/YnhG family)
VDTIDDGVGRNAPGRLSQPAYWGGRASGRCTFSAADLLSPPRPPLNAFSAAVLSLAGFFALVGGAPPPAATGPIPDASRQLLVVTTSSWSETSGTLRRFERDGASGTWHAVGTPVTVVVGRNGLGWGRGLHPAQRTGPQKREGDGRAPAGVYRLTEAFGYAPADSMETGLPYVQSDRDLECVDDVGSAYRRGVVVAHNTGPAQPGGGSCIFLHVWRGPGSTTSGCTAMPEDRLAESMAWLDRAADPVLVQLPTAEYRRLRRTWALPQL